MRRLVIALGCDVNALGTINRRPRPRPAVSVVLPVYRKLRTLPELHRRVDTALRALGRPYEILFVEDHGLDGALEWLCTLVAREPAVRLVALDFNHGQHIAILHGLAHARGDAMIVMDADLQDPPECIPLLLDCLPSDRFAPGVVFATSSGRRGVGLRRHTGRYFKWLLGTITGNPLPPGAGVFTAMTRRTAHTVLAGRARSEYLLLLLAWSGAPMRSVSVPRPRVSRRESSYTPVRRTRMAGRILLQAIWGRARGAGPTRPASDAVEADRGAQDAN